MNRVEKRKLIKGFFLWAAGEKCIEAFDPNGEEEEAFDYMLDEYLGMEDDVLTGAAAEMAAYVARECNSDEDVEAMADTVPPSRHVKPADVAPNSEDTIVGLAPPANPPSQQTLVFQRKETTEVIPRRLRMDSETGEVRHTDIIEKPKLED